MLGHHSTAERNRCFGLRILVAEDNHDAADSLAQLLTSWSHEVQVVYDGLSALEAARAYPPDVALIDLGLPGMDGYLVASQLRTRPGIKGMTLIAVTGHDWKNAERRSHEFGFDHHLLKPVDPVVLEKLLLGLATRTG